MNKEELTLLIQTFSENFNSHPHNAESDSFLCPDSLPKVHYKKGHPLELGRKAEGYAFFSQGMVFKVLTDTMIAEMKKKNQKKQEKSKDKKSNKKKEIPNYVKVEFETVAAYPDESLLISGWILGDKLIRQKAAILNVPFGKGKVVLFGFNVHNRAQSYANFKLLFNALYYN